jgi:hypothetical protein
MEGTVTIKLSDFVGIQAELAQLKESLLAANEQIVTLKVNVMQLEDKYCGTNHFQRKF